MKPVNAKELNRAYLVFSANFIILAAFAIFCLYMFFSARQYEYNLLQQDVDRAERMLAKRRDVNAQFDLVISRFNDLSKFTTLNAEELDNQAIMLQDIQKAVFNIKDLLKQQSSGAPSFQLYQKLADDVAQMAGIQDSLFNSRFQLESVKSQLESCLKLNHAAEDKLSLGIFRR